MAIFRSEMETQKPKVCVLDAASYVGFWILKELLRRGYTVHAALCNNEETEIARRIGEMKLTMDEERLSVFVVDVLDYQSILRALNGCSALFCSLEDQYAYDEKAVEMEVRGAINVVEACAHTRSMEKLVFSSSLAAGIWREDVRTIEDVDERCWSDVDLLQLWYALTKTLSEQAAWALAMDRMLNMVSINAALVLGPGIANQNAVSTSSYQHTVAVTAPISGAQLPPKSPAEYDYRKIRGGCGAGACFARAANAREGSSSPSALLLAR